MKTVAESRVLRALTHRLDALRPETPNRWGTLSAPEMLCHLGDSAEMVLGIRPRVGPVRSRTRRVVKWIGLWTPLRWPHGWRTNPAHDPRLAGTRPSVFTTDRQRVISAMAGIAGATPAALEPAHGVFGRMSVRDWQRYTYKHTDHHLRQFGL
jgi:hypothetical protein